MKNICFQMNRKAWIVALTILSVAFPALAQKMGQRIFPVGGEGMSRV